VKSLSGQTVTSENFRADVNASGGVTSTDIGLVKSKSGSTLPVSVAAKAASKASKRSQRGAFPHGSAPRFCFRRVG
jgi:hypothetical protein